MAHGWSECTCGRRMMCGSKCPNRRPTDVNKLSDEQLKDFQEFVKKVVERMPNKETESYSPDGFIIDEASEVDFDAINQILETHEYLKERAKEEKAYNKRVGNNTFIIDEVSEVNFGEILKTLGEEDE